MEWAVISACPSCMCSVNKGNIEGTKSAKFVFVYVLICVCVGIGFVDWFERSFIYIYIRERVLKSTFAWSEIKKFLDSVQYLLAPPTQKQYISVKFMKWSPLIIKQKTNKQKSRKRERTTHHVWNKKNLVCYRFTCSAKLTKRMQRVWARPTVFCLTCVNTRSSFTSSRNLPWNRASPASVLSSLDPFR